MEVEKIYEIMGINSNLKTIQDILDAITEKYGAFACDIWRFASSKSISKNEAKNYVKKMYMDFNNDSFEKFYTLGLECFQ